MIQYKVITNGDDWCMALKKDDAGYIHVLYEHHYTEKAVEAILKDMGIDIPIEIASDEDQEYAFEYGDFAKENLNKYFEE